MSDSSGRCDIFDDSDVFDDTDSDPDYEPHPQSDNCLQQKVNLTNVIQPCVANQGIMSTNVQHASVPSEEDSSSVIYNLR